jgi:hypothetical protein
MNARQRQLDTLQRQILRALAAGDRFTALLLLARLRAVR